MLKKLLREIDRLEQSKAKKVEQIKVLQDEVNKIDEQKYYAKNASHATLNYDAAKDAQEKTAYAKTFKK